MSDVGDSRMEDLPSLSPAVDEIGEYYFESDPLALKGNPDYQLLMKTLVRLQAQRGKAVRVSYFFSLHTYIHPYT